MADVLNNDDSGDEIEDFMSIGVEKAESNYIAILFGIRLCVGSWVRCTFIRYFGVF